MGEARKVHRLGVRIPPGTTDQLIILKPLQHDVYMAIGTQLQSTREIWRGLEHSHNRVRDAIYHLTDLGLIERREVSTKRFKYRRADAQGTAND